MKAKNEAMVLASFVGDALSLGVHWIYNTNVIDRKLGRVDRITAPEIASYHKGKPKGAFTHYGDQTLVLLESVAASGGFDPQDFARRWRTFFDTTEIVYVDGATKATRANLDADKTLEESGSESDDLGGAARIAPLVYALRGDEEQLMSAVRRQTAMTHNNPLVVEAAEIFARVALRVLNGEVSPTAALAAAATNSGSSDLGRMIGDGLDSAELDTRQSIKDFGQMCEIEAALPATVHLIARYEDNLSEALVENCGAGGDSAARGLLVGMVLGAYQGKEAIPEAWLADMLMTTMIREFLAKLS